MTHWKIVLSVLSRMLFALYGVFLVSTRPLRTIILSANPPPLWAGTNGSKDLSLRASWRILTMMDQIRLDPPTKQLIQMMLTAPGARAFSEEHQNKERE